MLGEFAPAVTFAHMHLVRVWVHACHLVTGVELDVVAVPESLGLCDQQLFAVGDFTAQVIGQPAVRKRRIAVFFVDDDASVFIASPCAGGSCGSTGNAANNYNDSIIRC